MTSSTEAYWPGEVLRILSNSSQHPSSASQASLTCAALTAFRRFATGPVSARLIKRQASYLSAFERDTWSLLTARLIGATAIFETERKLCDAETRVRFEIESCIVSRSSPSSNSLPPLSPVVMPSCTNASTCQIRHREGNETHTNMSVS